jgi:glutamate formiminotransferase / formiminotetrahydrofolate cyclodeaminase
MQILECVPNFSEGRDPVCIKRIAQSIEETKGVYLLDIDSNFTANRTVMTFIGEPESVCQAAYQAIGVAAELIDMQKHVGVHPRIGATDVCPLVPIQGLAMDDCIILSERLAQRVALKLNIPVFLYAHSARLKERKRLSFLRRGQYEGLQKRMQAGAFTPDFGGKEFNVKSGATIIGARDLLIAYNLNLSTDDRLVARRIAAEIRRKRDEIALGNESDSATDTFTAIGWTIPEFKVSQISMNLLDYCRFGLYQAYNEVKVGAKREGFAVTGSEIVGLVPKEALVRAGEGLIGQGEAGCAFLGGTAPAGDALINFAIEQLGLASVKPFDPQKKILDYHLQKLDMLRHSK